MQYGGRVCICAFGPDTYIYFLILKKTQKPKKPPHTHKKKPSSFFVQDLECCTKFDMLSFLSVYFNMSRVWRRKIRDSSKLPFMKWFILLTLESFKLFCHMKMSVLAKEVEKIYMCFGYNT